MKKLILISLFLALVFGLFIYFKIQKTDNQILKDDSQELFGSTMDLSRRYMLLHYETEIALSQPASFGSYESWRKEIERIVGEWQSLEKASENLEKTADKYVKRTQYVVFIPYVSAMTTKEINDIFDKAPAGKKIRTLAKHLGVDAKRAYMILQQTQNEVEAEAWNKAGDTFQKLETTAIVIKDVCKVTGFVGGVILSGGTAGLAAASTATKAAIIVTGADLVLEVSEDGANIALGNNNKISEFFGDARIFTEPLATILTITTLHENLASGMDKFNAVMLALDQFRSAAQEGKIIGIALPSVKPGQKGKILTATMTEAEVEEWLKGLGIERTDEGFEDIINKFKETAGMTEEEIVEKENSDVISETIDEVSTTTEETLTLPKETEEHLENFTSVTPIAYTKDGKVKLTFSGPAEDTFIPRQARGWRVIIENNDNLEGAASYECDFIFYLNGVKYQEMLKNRGCGFTHTFIEKEGLLRVEVIVRFSKGRSIFNDDGSYKEYVREVYDTVVLTREFIVASLSKK